MMPALSQIIESIIFVSDQPVNEEGIWAVLQGENEQAQEKKEKEGKEENETTEPADDTPQFSEAEIKEALKALVHKYEDDKYPFEIRKIAKGYQFFTKRSFHRYVKRATLEKNRRRLSRAAMETLAIVAYRQPVTKSEVEFIRGVNCDYAIQKLLEKQLVSIVGRADAVGRPLLYATSAYFMQHFGINSVEDLPKLKEFDTMVETHKELFTQHQTDLASSGGEGSDVRPTSDASEVVPNPSPDIPTEDHGETRPEES